MKENKPNQPSSTFELKDIFILLSCFLKEALNSEEAAHFLGISLTTLRHYTSENKIRYYKPMGGLVYFKKEDLIEFLLQNPVEPTSAIMQKALKENF